jgi:hypothetical protein
MVSLSFLCPPNSAVGAAGVGVITWPIALFLSAAILAFDDTSGSYEITVMLVAVVFWPAILVYLVVCSLPGSLDGFCSQRIRNEEGARFSCATDYLQCEFDKFLAGTIPVILGNAM